MHDIRWIHENEEAFESGLKRRGMPEAEAHKLTRWLITTDDRRRACIRVLEGFKERRNAASHQVKEAKASKDEETAQRLMAEVAECKASISRLEKEVAEAEDQLREALNQLPNLPAEDVPYGKDETANEERHKSYPDRNFRIEGFQAKQHFDLGEALGQMDFETAAKLSGARFVVLRNGLARLERALGQFMLDLHTSEHGYTEVAPPLLVRDETMFGTAQLPKFRDDQFPTNLEELIQPEEFQINVPEPGRIEIEFRGNRREQLKKAFKGKVYIRNPAISEVGWQGIAPIVETTRWLIPTAEVPLTNLVRESILDEAELPLRFTACTPCFRAEAGAAGKDTRGMMRQHQFTKVELVSITTPEQSGDEHERMLACAEKVLKDLQLHYRVVTLCTGDMGFASQKTYDIEVWLPGQGKYREISSCSNCGEFQARRMAARYRPRGGRDTRHVHTLNGSGVAVGRALIAVMETYQQGNGAIAVPDALQPYMGGMKVIE